MKHALITTAAAALLLASQGAIAQPQNRGDGPGAGPGGNAGQAPPQAQGPGPAQAPAGPPARAPGAGNSDGPRGNAPGKQGPAAGPRAEQQKPQGQQPRAEQQAPQKGAQPRTGEAKQPPAQQPRADVKGKDAEKNRTARDATPPKAETKDNAAPGKDNAAKDAPRKDAADRGKDADRKRNDTAQGKDDAKAKGERTAGAQDLRQARERLDVKERTRLHTAFDRRTAKANVRVNVHIGDRVPRNLRLVRVPTTVIAFFPYYRNYSYFVEEETVYIVDPRTYAVVDVIDEGFARGQPVQQARLNLSEPQIALVREAIASSDIRAENLRLRLALGAEIPRDVELHRFPARVLDNVRDLENFRFVLVDDQIVIVAPGDRSIALVIERT